MTEHVDELVEKTQELLEAAPAFELVPAGELHRQARRNWILLGALTIIVGLLVLLVFGFWRTNHNQHDFYEQRIADLNAQNADLQSLLDQAAMVIDQQRQLLIAAGINPPDVTLEVPPSPSPSDPGLPNGSGSSSSSSNGSNGSGHTADHHQRPPPIIRRSRGHGPRKGAV